MVTKATFPDQRVSTKKKQTDADWYIPTIDYIISRALASNDKKEVKLNIDYANGIIDEKTYEYVSKKYGTDEVKLPADIRELDLITPIKERYIGEYIRQHSNFQVFNNDYDTTVLRNKELGKEVENLLAQQLINYLNQDTETGMPSQETPDIEEFSKEFIDNWVDERAIKAMHKIKLIETLTNATVLYIQGFFYWWATEQVYSYRTIRNNDLVKEIVSPLEYYRVRGKSIHVEDDPMGMRLQTVNIIDIINNDREKLDETNKKYLDELYKISIESHNSAVVVDITLVEGRREFAYYKDRGDTIEARELAFCDNSKHVPHYHIVWKSLTKVGYLTYWNEIGQVDEMVVDETYKLNEEAGDIDLQWDWIPEVFEADRYGHEMTGLYIPPRPLDVQRESITNVADCKLPYGGLSGMLNDSLINPVPKRLAPLMALYRIYTLQQERFVAKFRGDIMPVPESMITDTDNFTRSERLNAMLSDNMLFYNDAVIDPQLANSIRAVGNPGIERYIGTLSELRREIKAEAWELANMNEQRFGDINPNAGKSTTEYAITKSTTGSILMFEMYNQFRQADYKADLDYANVAWIDGKNGSYYDTVTKKIVYVTIDPLEQYSENIGLYFENSVQEEERLAALRDLAFNMSQNGEFDLAAEAINTDSSVFITRLIRKEMKARKELEEKLKLAESENYAKGEQAKAETEQLKMQHEDNINKRNNDTKIEVAYINADVEMMKLQMGEGGIPEGKEDEYKQAMLAIKKRELGLKERQNGIDMTKALKQEKVKAKV